MTKPQLAVVISRYSSLSKSLKSYFCIRPIGLRATLGIVDKTTFSFELQGRFGFYFNDDDLPKQAVTGPTKDRKSESESESELFTGDTSKDNHSPGPVFREVSP